MILHKVIIQSHVAMIEKNMKKKLVDNFHTSGMLPVSPNSRNLDSHPAFPKLYNSKMEYTGIRNKKRRCIAPSCENLGHRGHLANEQDTTGPGQSPAQGTVFWCLTRLAERRMYANCPLS